MRPPVKGVDLDAQTRCAHWRSPLDIIALRMWCCGTYYACRDCHDALADHEAEVTPRAQFDQPAVLCGACGTELTVNQYLACASRCPNCGSGFNPGCHKHLDLYFETDDQITSSVIARGGPRTPPRLQRRAGPSRG